MSRSVEQKIGQEGFIKPGELIDIRAGEHLTLQDRRIFNLLIQNAWSEIDKDKGHRIAIASLRGGTHRGSERVADSVKALMTTLVEVPTTIDGVPSMFATQLLGSTTRTIDEDTPHAVLVYEFPRGLREIIAESGYWGRIKAYVMFAFSSKYALALYEAVCLRGNLYATAKQFTVEEFRALLGVEPGKLPLFKSLKQRVLDPALAEVNALSDYQVEIEPVRDGGLQRGPLKGFVLRWEKKPAEAWKAALDELGRSRVGRIARITGRVEPIV